MATKLAIKNSRNINTREDMIILSENSLVFITKSNKISRTTELLGNFFMRLEDVKLY